MNWLFKEEPTHYSFDDLVRDGRTEWSGVKNPLAQKHLHGVRKGDRIFYYHTGRRRMSSTPSLAEPLDALAFCGETLTGAKARLVTLGLIGLATLFYLCPLALDIPLIDPDEGLHAAIAQALLVPVAMIVVGHRYEIVYPALDVSNRQARLPPERDPQSRARCRPRRAPTAPERLPAGHGPAPLPDRRRRVSRLLDAAGFAGSRQVARDYNPPTL